jgi:hypothetical protein
LPSSIRNPLLTQLLAPLPGGAEPCRAAPPAALKASMGVRQPPLDALGGVGKQTPRLFAPAVTPLSAWHGGVAAERPAVLGVFSALRGAGVPAVAADDDTGVSRASGLAGGAAAAPVVRALLPPLLVPPLALADATGLPKPALAPLL